MANFAGKDGVVKTGSDTVAELRSWEYTEEVDVSPDNAQGDANETYLTGVKRGRGTISCMWDDTDTTGQVAIEAGEVHTLHLQPEGDTSGDADLTGSVTIVRETTALPNPGSDPVTRDYEFQGVLARATVT